MAIANHDHAPTGTVECYTCGLSAHEADCRVGVTPDGDTVYVCLSCDMAGHAEGI